MKVPVFTILTTEAAEEIRFIHDRMPVMLAKDDAEKWIGMNGDMREFSNIEYDRLNMATKI